MIPWIFIVIHTVWFRASPTLAGCRYTNPEWDSTQSTAPSIQLGLTSSDLQVSAKWNISSVTQYPQCVDKIILATDSTVLCSADLSLESCESSDLKRTDVCQNPNVQLWLTLINEDHKDGPQHIRAPYSTNIQEFCSTDPKISIEKSEHCEAVVPVWEGMPTVEYLKGRVGLRHVKMNWSNSILQGFHCIDFFEVKYWPKGKASLSFVTSAIKAKTNEDSADYSTQLEVEKCKEYTYVIRVSKSNPTVVVSERGSFMSKCKNNNSAAEPKSIKTTAITTKRTTTTTTTTTTSTTTTTTTTMSSTTTTTASTTTTTTTTTTSTSSVSITQTTRLDAMLFNSQEPATTEKDDQRLEDLLFKEEETMIPENTSRSSVSSSARLPKTSKDIGINNNDIENDSSPAMTTTTIEESEITTETLMKVSTTLQAVDYFEYVETEREEDIKYLENAIGVPEDTTIQVEGRGFQADEPTDFDEYLKSVTKATVGKNARALQFDENSAAPKNNGLVMSTILILLCFAIVF